MDPGDGGNSAASRLAIDVTDAKELRCTGSTSEWEVRANVVARDLAQQHIDSAALAVAYWPTAGAARHTAPVRILERDGFASGVSSDAEALTFHPVVHVELPCGSEAAQLIARVRVAGRSLDASDEFLSSGVAMASPLIVGMVLIGLFGTAYLVTRR